MKNFLENIKAMFKDKEITTQKTIGFFAFYLVFFIAVFGLIFLGGNRDYLKQEYEPGNSSETGTLSTNYVFDYKINYNGVLYDYYGKRRGDVELFKYNNLDYYRDGDEFFVEKDNWTKTDNPYLYYEFIDFDKMALIFQEATLMNQKELDNGDTQYDYLVSINTINEALYEENSDYDEVPDSISILVDSSSNNVKKITYQLDHFCSHRSNCKNLKIEMNFEMFGSVEEIDNPME